MGLIYGFTDRNSLADWLMARAVDKRASAARLEQKRGRNKAQRDMLLGEAYAYENIADVVRSCELTEITDLKRRLSEAGDDASRLRWPDRTGS